MENIIKCGQNDQEYRNLIDSFVSRFEQCFGNGKTQLVKDRFKENLKGIKVHKDVPSFQMFPIRNYLSGVYNVGTRILEYAEKGDEDTIFHEMFHALSRKQCLKRSNFSQTIAYALTNFNIRNNLLSTREFEEGMTEYLTTCLFGIEYKSMPSAYDREHQIISKLSKIYGDELILEYYLGENSELVNRINNEISGGFDRILRLCKDTSQNFESLKPFEPVAYCHKKNIIEYDNILFETFAAKKMIEPRNISDLKHNIKLIFYFYQEDLCRNCLDIKNAEKYELNGLDIIWAKEAFQRFDQVLRNECHKLNLDSEEMYYSIIIDEIESIDDEFTKNSVIKYLKLWSEDLAQFYENKKGLKPENPVEKESNGIEYLKQLKQDITEDYTKVVSDEKNIYRHK